MGIKHSKVATAPDEAGAEVNKTEWNADHVVDDGSLTIAKTTGLQTALDGKQNTIEDIRRQKAAFMKAYKEKKSGTQKEYEWKFLKYDPSDSKRKQKKNTG